MDVSRRVGVIALMALSAIPLAAQQPTPVRPIPPGTSTIRGQVLDSITRTSVAGCPMRVVTSGNLSIVTSDQDGAFELNNVAAGEYFVTPQCPAHVHSCFGPDLPRSACSIEVARDQVRDGVVLHVTPGAIARGQVLTFDGRPVTRASVRLGRGVRAEPTPQVAPSTTDVDGRFELVNLPAGEWRIEVEIPPEPGNLTPPVVYYPGGLSWEDAVGVELTAGKAVDGLTITVPKIYENVLTVVVPPPDATISQVSVSVLQRSPLVTRRLTVNAEGTATLKGVMPGRYFVVALASSQDERWAGFEAIDFVEDSYEARLQLLPTGTITGTIVVEQGTPPDLNGAIVGASWLHDGEEVNPLELTETTAAADGSFRIDSLYGTRKLQVRALDPGWEVAAIRQGRTDMTEIGIAVVPGSTTEATIVLRRRP